MASAPFGKALPLPVGSLPSGTFWESWRALLVALGSFCLILTGENGACKAVQISELAGTETFNLHLN